jgi:hypothetical protein
MAYAFLAFSLALAVALLAVGIRQHMPPDATGAIAGECWAPKGDPTRCYPKRPTRDAR